jgi:predicted permease
MRQLLHVLRARLAGLLRRGHLDVDFREELRTHEAMLTEDLERRGVARDEARRRARIVLGNPTALAQEHRERRTWRLLADVGADVRVALRQFRRRPGFTLIAMLTMALGIGVNTTVFSALNAVALRPLPIAGADRAVRVERWAQSGLRGTSQFVYSYAEYAWLHDHLDVMADLVAISLPAPVNSRASQELAATATAEEPYVAEFVSDNFFASLGPPTQLGRAPTSDELRISNSAPVIFLSDRGWRTRFGADPAIVGTAIRLNGASYTVVGVGAPTFIGIGNPPAPPDFWASLGLKVAMTSGLDWMTLPSVKPLRLIGHVVPTASIAAASARARSFAAALMAEFPAADPTINLTLEPATYFGETNDPRFLLFLSLLAVVVGLILLAACANLTNMLLARAAGRTREFALRLAIGASRGRVIRQLLVESVLLSIAGGTVALILAVWGSHVLWVRVAEAIQIFAGGRGALLVDLSPDVRVLAFAMALAVGAGVVFGLAPARQLARTDLVTGLSDAGAGQGLWSHRPRLRTWLIVSETAIAMTLAIVAGLLARGLDRGGSAQASIDTRHLYYVGYASDPDPTKAATFQRQLLQRLTADPAVSAGTLMSTIPFGGTWTREVYGDSGSGTSTTFSHLKTVSSTYFTTMGIPLVRGRGFTLDEADTGAPIAVVSASAARTLWPDRDPIGQTIRFSTEPRRGGSLSTFTVIGVTGDARTVNISRDDPAFVYWPTKRADEYVLVIRSTRSAPGVTTAVRGILGTMDPNLLRTLVVVQIEDGFVRPQRVLPAAIGTFAMALAVLSLVLAAAGIFGIVSFIASQRTREFGIRTAIGATSARLLRLVLTEGLAPVGIGMIFGLIGATGIAAVFRSVLQLSPSSPDLLFGVGAFDPLTFGAMTIVVAAAALAAAAVPAWRAGRVDPLAALRRS